MSFKPWCCFLYLILNCQSVSDETSSLIAVIIWNAGYSNYITQVSLQSCHHFDPGGTLKTFSSVKGLCAGKKNLFFTMENDGYHTRYFKELLHLLKPQCRSEDCFSNKATRLEPILVKSNHKVIGGVLTTKHFKTALDYDRLSTTNFTNTNYLILPNHGQKKFLNLERLNQLAQFKMVITGNKSRSMEHHEETEKKFFKIGKRIILKKIWGHLIFLR